MWLGISLLLFLSLLDSAAVKFFVLVKYTCQTEFCPHQTGENRFWVYSVLFFFRAAWLTSNNWFFAGDFKIKMRS